MIPLGGCDIFEYTCLDGTCIDRDVVCDGVSDCPGAFDKYDCGM